MGRGNGVFFMSFCRDTCHIRDESEVVFSKFLSFCGLFIIIHVYFQFVMHDNSSKYVPTWPYLTQPILVDHSDNTGTNPVLPSWTIISHDHYRVAHIWPLQLIITQEATLLQVKTSISHVKLGFVKIQIGIRFTLMKKTNLEKVKVGRQCLYAIYIYGLIFKHNLFK